MDRGLAAALVGALTSCDAKLGRIFVVGICFTQVVADVAVETLEAQKAHSI